MADSVWLAQLAECGLLRASFVPPEPIRQLRDLTRFRSVLADERVREAARLEKELEDAGIKLSVVVSDILGVSARAMLEALIRGERDPQVLAELARGRMRPKIPDLMEAMIGRFSTHADPSDSVWSKRAGRPSPWSPPSPANPSTATTDNAADPARPLNAKPNVPATSRMR